MRTGSGRLEDICSGKRLKSEGMHSRLETGEANSFPPTCQDEEKYSSPFAARSGTGPGLAESPPEIQQASRGLDVAIFHAGTLLGREAATAGRFPPSGTAMCTNCAAAGNPNFLNSTNFVEIAAPHHDSPSRAGTIASVPALVNTLHSSQEKERPR